MQSVTMWSSRNRSTMLLTTRQYTHLAVIVLFAVHTITMADAQNLALSSTTPKLVHGTVPAAANPLSNCSNVRKVFESQGINGADIPAQPISGKCQFNHIHSNSIRLYFASPSKNSIYKLNAFRKGIPQKTVHV